MEVIENMRYENLLVEKENNICTIRINRPYALNALNQQTYIEIYEIFKELEKDNDTDIIILTGQGKSFVAGADIKFMKDLNSYEGKVFGELGKKAFSAVENIDKVVIAAINGYALGGGCELALSCDIRIASENAKLGQPEVTLGITPGSGGTQRLPRIVGMAKAKELIFTGEMIDANEAYKIGLVNKVVKQEDLMDEAYNMANKILKNGQHAVKYSKEAINKGCQVDIDTGLSIESSLFGLCFATNDQKEGMSAFVQKRKANFSKN